MDRFIHPQGTSQRSRTYLHARAATFSTSLSLTTGWTTKTFYSIFTSTRNGVVSTGTHAAVSSTGIVGVPSTGTTTFIENVPMSTTISGTPELGIGATTVTSTYVEISTLPRTSIIATVTKSFSSTSTVYYKLIHDTKLVHLFYREPELELIICNKHYQLVYCGIESILLISITKVHLAHADDVQNSHKNPLSFRTSNRNSNSSNLILKAHVPLWFVAIPATLVLIIMALLYLWHKCARKSFDKAGCFLHAVFETIGGMIFGKRWDTWKATRHENRRKKAVSSNRLSSLSDGHVREYVLYRWNESAEHHRNEGTMARYSTPPSTAPSGETWRQADRETLVGSPRPEVLEMMKLGARPEPASNSLAVAAAKAALEMKGKGRAVPSTLSILPEASPLAASPLAIHDENTFNEVAPWLEPHPGTPWFPPEPTPPLTLVPVKRPRPVQTARQVQTPSSDLTSAPVQTSVPVEISHPVQGPVLVKPSTLTADLTLRSQIRASIEAKRQALLSSLDADDNPDPNINPNIEADSHSSPPFRSARGVWPVIHPQPLLSPAKISSLAAAVIDPSTPRPEPSLPADHPISRIPSPKSLPGREIGSERERGISKRSGSKLNVLPLELKWRSANQGTVRKPGKGHITSFLGWNKHPSSSSSSPEKGPPIISHPQPSPDTTPLAPDPLPTTATATCHTSLSQWTDASTPGTALPLPTNPASTAWANLIAGQGLGPSNSNLNSSVSSVQSCEGPPPGTDCAVSPRNTTRRRQFPSASPSVLHTHHRRPDNISSFYSGYWEDDCGGKIEYDHYGKIKDIEFQDHVRVPLDKTPSGSGSEGEGRTETGNERDVEKGKGRGKDKSENEPSKSQMDLNNYGYQRDRRGNWI